MADKQMSILIVDDSQDNLTILQALIKEAFPDSLVYQALNGKMGIELAEKTDPDTILLDIVMPGMDGFEVCRKLKANEDLCDIPVVFITAIKGDKKSHIEALECGAEAFLAKPIDFYELIAQIQSMVKIRNANRQKRDENIRLSHLVEQKTEQLTKEIEARKQNEIALQFERDRANIYLETANVIMLAIDKEGTVTRINEKGCAILGYRKEDIIGKNWLNNFLPETETDEVRKVFDAIVSGGIHGFEHYENSITTANGEKRIVSWHNSLLYDEENNIIGILSSGIDSTEEIEYKKKLKQSEERFQLLFNKAPMGYQSLDADGKFIDVNQQWLDTFGYSREEVIGNEFIKFVSPEYHDKQKKYFKIFKEQGNIHCELEMSHKNGTCMYMAFEGKMAYEADGSFKQTHCILQDITKQKEAQEALKESEKKYSSYIKNAPYGIFILNQDGRYIEVNPTASAITGYSREELLDMTLSDIIADESLREVTNQFEDFRNKGEFNSEFMYKHKDGSVRWWTMRAVKLEEERFLAFTIDITDRKKDEKALVHLSYHDQLTGLYNRRFFEEELARMDVKRNLPLSIIMGDINGLKLINDSFGHDVGDEYLKKTAEIIQKTCRTDDIIARLGGDEFAVILTKTDAAETMKIIARIKDMVLNAKVRSIELSVSFGYATKEKEEHSIMESIISAENYMYTHKLVERSSQRSKMVDIIMNALFEKSNRESQHSKRVSAICEAIAVNMGLEKDDVNQIRIAGLVHDIGKIGIAEKILNKAGILENDEWVEMKKHPEAGWRILSTSAEFSEVAEFVLHHHERWDGTGYPNGLAGEEIPLVARIIAVADTYDAMTSERSYRKPVSMNTAVDEIRRFSGKQYDPKIANVFADEVISQLYLED